MAGSAASTVATGTGRGTLILGGPIATALVVVRVWVPVAAAAVIIDAIRRPARDFATPYSRWLWVAPQAVMLVFVLMAVVGGPTTTEPIAGLILLWGAASIVLQFAYLLRVVFPKPVMEDAAWNEADAIEFAEGLGQVPPREGGPQPLEGSQED